MHPSPCGRFVVFSALHLDRELVAGLANWSEARGMTVQDAIQLAVAFFTEHAIDGEDVSSRRRLPPQPPTSAPEPR